MGATLSRLSSLGPLSSEVLSPQWRGDHAGPPQKGVDCRGDYDVSGVPYIDIFNVARWTCGRCIGGGKNANTMILVIAFVEGVLYLQKCKAIHGAQSLLLTTALLFATLFLGSTFGLLDYADLSKTRIVRPNLDRNLLLRTHGECRWLEQHARIFGRGFEWRGQTGHPFDTIKVRLQTSTSTRFAGPWSCLCQTISQDGVRGLYKGLTPPLVGFVFMDSLLLGSFSIYRDFLNRISQHPEALPVLETGRAAPANLSSASVSFIAGGLAGWTVSFIAAPIEHVKARLQVQYGRSKYAGPTDCFREIYQDHGISGLYRGLSATIIFRSFFAFFWGSYDVMNRTMQASTSLSVPLINFMAAGVAAQLYWLTGYPTDVIKQRIMTEPLGGVTNDGVRRLVRWKDAARSIYTESGWRGFWRGFLPCFLRAFPANAMSIVTFEAVMRSTTSATV